MSLQLPAVDPGDPRYVTRGAHYVPALQGPTVWAAGDVYTIKATAAQTRGLLGFIEATVPPGGGPEPHAHNDQAETFYLLSGELEFLDGDRTFTAAAGDFVHVPAGIRHRFKNKTAHATRMIFLFTPGGPEEAFVQYFDPARPGELPPPLGPDQLERYVEMARRTNTDNLPDLT
jgi:mannose-6-phosphate isomerase-like protein (cupin superfamily)